jgi:hypothetical protein
MNKAAAMLEHGASAAEVLKHFLRKGRPPSLQGHWPAKNREPGACAAESRVQRAGCKPSNRTLPLIMRRAEYLGKVWRYSPWTGRLLDAAEQTTERRHFAQLPDVLQGATFSGSLGMRR